MTTDVSVTTAATAMLIAFPRASPPRGPGGAETQASIDQANAAVIGYRVTWMPPCWEGKVRAGVRVPSVRVRASMTSCCSGSAVQSVRR